MTESNLINYTPMEFGNFSFLVYFIILVELYRLYLVPIKFEGKYKGKQTKKKCKRKEKRKENNK